MKRGRVSSLASDTAAMNIDETSIGPSKYVALDEAPHMSTAIWCSLPPHEPQTFQNSILYESHYLAEHSHRCSECHHNFPSAHFLDLHITELHDPICASRRDAGDKTYACFVEGCDKVCLDWKKRRSHLIDKHGYPRNYDFFVVKDGIDGRKSLLRAGVDDKGHRRSSRERQGSDTSEQHSLAVFQRSTPRDQMSEEHCTQGGGTDNGSQDVKLPQQNDEALHIAASTLSSFRMVPRNIKFGRKTGPTGFSTR